MVSILEEFDAVRPNNFFVTDNGVNIKAAFQDHIWLKCSGHNINLAISNMLDKRKKEQQIDNEDEEFEFDPLSPILGLVSTSKEIVTRGKRSRIQGQLSTALKQAVSTRWNSIFVMIKSISKNLPDLKNVDDRQLQKSLMDINDSLLINIIKVLEHLDTATRLLSTDKTPTLHMVLLVRVRLLNNLSVMADDTESTKALKIELSKQKNIIRVPTFISLPNLWIFA